MKQGPIIVVIAYWFPFGFLTASICSIVSVLWGISNSNVILTGVSSSGACRAKDNHKFVEAQVIKQIDIQLFIPGVPTLLSKSVQSVFDSLLIG